MEEQPEKPERTKATKAATSKRVDEIYAMLLKETPRRRILRYVSKKGWGIGDRAVDYLIRKANRRIKNQSEKSADFLFKKHVNQRRMLFSEAIEQNDLRTALRILDSLATLEGVNDYIFLEMQRQFAQYRKSLEAVRATVIENNPAPASADYETKGSEGNA